VAQDAVPVNSTIRRRFLHRFGAARRPSVQRRGGRLHRSGTFERSAENVAHELTRFGELFPEDRRGRRPASTVFVMAAISISSVIFMPLSIELLIFVAE
jgi:hypothetical protein